MKDTISNFISNVLSVILGIVITFTVQGMIDRAHEREAVCAALGLVRTELAANAADVDYMADYILQMRQSAVYLLNHRKHLDECPADSVFYHQGIVFADAAITLSSDALELLKMSSLFQKIDDTDLSMKIIRAYDACNSLATVLNRHNEQRNAHFENSVNERTAESFAATGSIDIADYLQTPYGLYAIRWLLSQGDVSIFTDTSDIDEAVSAIDEYLQRHTRRKSHQTPSSYEEDSQRRESLEGDYHPAPAGA